MKIGVMLYPYFSLQEITTLTSCLVLWFGQKIDYIGTRLQPYESEDGFLVTPTVKIADIDPAQYDCIVLPGIMNPLPALFDDEAILFLSQLRHEKTLIAAISSSPVLLAKAGLLNNVKFTAGIHMQMAEIFQFINQENFIHQPVIEDGNFITAIGFAYKEFAHRVLKRLGYHTDDSLIAPLKNNYTEDELTFYWEESDYQEFLSELRHYTGE